MAKQKVESEKLAFEPPEPQYITEREKFMIDLSDTRLKNPWGLRLYASELVRQKIGDDAQITSVKVKKPGLFRKTLIKLKGQKPYALLYVTIKF